MNPSPSNLTHRVAHHVAQTPSVRFFFTEPLAGQLRSRHERTLLKERTTRHPYEVGVEATRKHPPSPNCLLVHLNSPQTSYAVTATTGDDDAPADCLARKRRPRLVHRRQRIPARAPVFIEGQRFAR